MKPLKQVSFPKIVIFSLALLGLLTYANSLSNPFIWDDFDLVAHNTSITSWSDLPQIFSGNVVTNSSFYRPLQMVTYLFDHQIWGLNPKGFHFTSIVLHILVSLVLCWVLFLLTENKILSLLASGLFLVHPIHNEAVAYIAGRADPLSALFLLLAFVFYLKNEREETPLYFVSSVFSFILAILSKEYALILPFLILAYHFSFKRRVQWVLWSFLTVLAAVFIVLRLQGILGMVDMHLKTETTVMQRLPATFEAMLQYVRLLFFPYNLTMGYGQKIVAFTSVPVLAGLAVYIGLVATAFRVRARHALISFALFWYLVGLIPVMNIYPVNAYMAEHWLYIPSIGFFVLAAVFLEKLFQTKERRHMALLCVTLMAGVYIFLSVKQNELWSNPLRFYERIVRINPTFIKAYNNLGKMNAEGGNCPKAVAYFQKAIAVDPQFAKAYNNAAVCFAKMGQKDKAMDYYQKALKVEPKFVPTYNNLGVLFMEEKDFKRAQTYFDKAVKLDPKEPKTYYNLGVLAEMQGHFEEAVLHYKEALKVDPSYKEAKNNMAGALSKRSKKDKAISYYKKLIKDDPTNALYYNNLGVIYMKQGRLDEAIDEFAQALSKKKDYAEASYNIGTAFYKKKSLGQAMHHLQDALRADPEHFGATTNLGIVYAMQGKLKQAEQMFKRALYLNPSDIATYNNLGLVLAREGKYDEAILNYKTAVQKDPTYKESQNNMAIAYDKKGNLQAAKEHYEKAIALDPKFVNALNGLGVVYGKLGDYKAAAKLFQQALNIQPDYRDAIFNLRKVEMLLGAEKKSPKS